MPMGHGRLAREPKRGSRIDADSSGDCLGGDDQLGVPVGEQLHRDGLGVRRIVIDGAQRAERGGAEFHLRAGGGAVGHQQVRGQRPLRGAGDGPLMGALDIERVATLGGHGAGDPRERGQ